jgi:hypothetical protein
MYLAKFAFQMSALFLSLAMIVVCGFSIARFFFLEDEFTVGDSYLTCQQPLNNRCIRHYTVYREGKAGDDFVPFGAEFVSGYLEKGLRFDKKFGGFSYEIDQRAERWPLLTQQAVIFLLGCLGLGLWYSTSGPAVFKKWVRSFKRNSGDRKDEGAE